MGDPNIPTEYGDNCLNCYASGKTPKYFACTIANVHIDGSYPDVNGLYLIPQHPVTACYWLEVFPFGAYTLEIGLNLINATVAYCSALLIGEIYAFIGEDAKCALSFSNYYDSPPRDYWGGTMKFEPTSLLAYANYSGGFYSAAAAKNELLTDEPGNKVIRTVNPTDKTNFKIKTDYP